MTYIHLCVRYNMLPFLCHRGLEDDEGVHTMESEEDEFAAIQRNAEILKSVWSLFLIIFISNCMLYQLLRV